MKNTITKTKGLSILALLALLVLALAVVACNNSKNDGEKNTVGYVVGINVDIDDEKNTDNWDEESESWIVKQGNVLVFTIQIQTSEKEVDDSFVIATNNANILVDNVANEQNQIRVFGAEVTEEETNFTITTVANMQSGQAAIETIKVKVVSIQEPPEEMVMLRFFDDKKFLEKDDSEFDSILIDERSIENGEIFVGSEDLIPTHPNETFQQWVDSDGKKIDFTQPLRSSLDIFAEFKHNIIDINYDRKQGQYVIQSQGKNKDIEYVIIPRYVTKIEERAFLNSKLATIEFEQESNLTEIQDIAFANTKINQIIIPKSVVKVGKSLFSGNKTNGGIINNPVDQDFEYLARIVAEGSVKSWDKDWASIENVPGGVTHKENYYYVSLVDAPNGIWIDINETNVDIQINEYQELSIEITVVITILSQINSKDYTWEYVDGAKNAIISRTQTGENYIVGLEEGITQISAVSIANRSVKSPIITINILKE